MNFKHFAGTIVLKRKNALDNYHVAIREAINYNKELLDIEKQIKQFSLDSAKGKKVDSKKLASLLKEKEAKLTKLGLPKTPPPPNCKKCNDTAFVANQFCSCVIAYGLKDSKNICIPLVNFSDIDYKRFDKKHLERSKKVFADMQKLANKYPNNQRKIVTVLGSAGTGKTLLAGCTAKHLLSNGYSAVAITAFDFINRALKFHTTFNENKSDYLEPLLISDLLIIDDLGTEGILKNITHEYLYSILAERIANNKLTLITTNLSKDGILERYGERIYSRLFDKTLSYANILNGKDLRI